MKIVIIEDELPAYRRLAKLITELEPGAEIVAHLDSVRDATQWFAAHEAPDLTFMDIHLSDGSAFELFQTAPLPCPVVFVTAYDQYAIDAFKTNSIDYLLKPVKKEELEAALAKLGTMRSLFGTQITKPAPAAEPAAPGSYKTRFVVRFGEHIKTIQTEDLAYCYSENKATFARTFDGRTYPMDQNLDSLDSQLDPHSFFRINRQYLINIKAIDEMKTYTKARVIVKLNPAVKEAPVVSSERAAEFKQWLAGEL